MFYERVMLIEVINFKGCIPNVCELIQRISVRFFLLDRKVYINVCLRF